MELVPWAPHSPSLPQEDASAWILLCGCAAWTALTLPPGSGMGSLPLLSMGTATSHEAAGVGGEIHLHPGNLLPEQGEERGRGRSRTATQSRPTPRKSTSRTPARTTATSSIRRHRSPSRTTSRIPLQVSIAAEVKRLSRRGPLRELGARREETATSALRDLADACQHPLLHGTHLRDGPSLQPWPQLAPRRPTRRNRSGLRGDAAGPPRANRRPSRASWGGRALL